MATAIFSRPYLLLRICSFAIMLCAIGCVGLILRVPIASVQAAMGDGGKIDLTDGRGSIPVAGDAPVTFRSRATGQSATLPASLLPDVTEPRGSRADNARYWRDRDRVAAMLAAGPVDVVADGRRLLATARRRSLSDLTIGFWLSMVAGAVAALVGLWVWVLRPRGWAPAMFALSGVGLFVGCATTALNVTPGLGLSGTIDQVMLVVNYLSGLLCAGTLVALFARFPTDLVGARWLNGLAIVSVAAGFVVTFDIVPHAVDVAIIVVTADSVAIVGLIGLQTWRARRDPESRAGLMPIAIGTAISTTLFVGLTMVGQVGGGRPLVMPDMTAPLLLLTYLGLGIAIMRARLFALGRWALGMLLSACAIILFLVLDIVLLNTVTQQRDLAFFLAAATGATVYLPAREWLLRRAERLRDGQASNLLQCAGDLALALTPQAAAAAWRGAVATMFDALDVDPVAYRGPDAAISENGSTLYLPEPMGGDALLLRYPGGGARMFGPDDLDTAARFAGLVRRLVESRDAYLRGVTEERSRIARDLHDDVSARLLSSLHRTDRDAMHDDVRGAMADIRTIVTGLSGDPQSLHALLAGLRHETQARLEAAGIALDWPLTAAGDTTTPLDYARYRHLLSIVRECVTNIIRHSGASMARIWIDLVDDRLIVEVGDDGCGIAAAAPPGNGLANGARRAAALGGTFGIVPTERGATVKLDIPFAGGR